MAYIGVGLDRIQTVEKLDNITFNGGATYNLTKGSTAFTPIGADHIICSINGVVQFGNFTVSGSQITFTGATLTSSDTMDFIFQIGTGVALTPNDNSVTAAKLSTAGISSGQVFKVNDAGNGWELGNASSAEVYGFEKYYTPSTIHIAVTESGGKYVIDGVSQKTIELQEGNTYVFTHPSAHPFRFSTDSGNTSAYSTGVTVNSSTQVTFVVPSGAPTLYYYCTSHSGMGGQANTPAPRPNKLRYITTNQGQDNITNATYATFSDVLYSASGFTFSMDSNGDLIATI
mgnify:CR=1 FL=1